MTRVQPPYQPPQIPASAHGRQLTTTSTSWRLAWLRRFRWRRRVCLPVLLFFAAMTLVGFVEEHGGVRRWVMDAPAELLASLSPPPLGALGGGKRPLPTWRVLTFPDGELNVSSEHPRLHRQLPTGRLELETVRREVFASDVIACSASRDFGAGWTLCAVGEFALAGNRSCVGVYVSDGDAAEFEGRLPCSTVRGFRCSGQSVSSSPSDAAPLADLLRSAATRGAPIDALLAACTPHSSTSTSPALEAAAHAGLLDSVKQLVLVTPAAVRHPLQQLHLLTALHANGLRQWSHRRLPVDLCPARLQTSCWHQRLLNERYLLDHAGLAKAAGWEAAIELQLAERPPSPDRVLGGPPHVRCPRARQLGDCANNGSGTDVAADDDCWHVCFSEAFNIAAAEPNCLALVFGDDVGGRSSGGGRRFQDALVDQYGCWVFSFSSRSFNWTSAVTRRSHRLRKTLWRYRARLGSSNSVDDSGLKVRTLCSIIRRLGYDADRPIDLVKLDARQDPQLDWTAGLSGAVKEGCLRQVKQLILVTDSHRSAGSAGSDYAASYMGVWQDLMRLGFRVWQHHSLPPRGSDGAGSGCHGHYLVNLHFSSLSLYVEKL